MSERGKFTDQYSKARTLAEGVISFNAEGLIPPASMAETVYKLTNAEQYIRAVSVLNDEGRVDFQATADRIGIRLEWDAIDHGFFTAGYINHTGPFRDGETPVIGLFTDRQEHDNALTFGHEVGHYFFDEVVGIERVTGDHTTELLCNYFGLMTALQDLDVESIQEISEDLISEISRRYNVSVDNVIWFFMEKGMLPPIIAIDGRNGILPNEDYTYRCQRDVICRDSKYDKCQHEELDLESLQVFDYTQQVFPYSALSPNLTHFLSGCSGHRAEYMRGQASLDLTKMYNQKHQTLQIPLFILKESMSDFEETKNYPVV